MNVDIDISNVTLKTNRLILRPFKLEDLDDFYEYASVDGVGQMAGWSPHKNKDESLAILKRFIEEKKTFAIVFNNKVIGSIGIEKYPESELTEFNNLKGREIGYVLAKPFWGNGLMPEGVKEVINYLFDKEKLDFLVCGHYVSNNQSKRVQEKCGFVHYKQVFAKGINGEKIPCWLSILKNNKR